MRILLIDPVLDGHVERAVRILRQGDIRVGSGATIVRDDAPAQGAITLLVPTQLPLALELPARFGIGAIAAG